MHCIINMSGYQFSRSHELREPDLCKLFFLCNPTLLVSHLVHSVGLDPLVALESLPGRSR